MRKRIIKLVLLTVTVFWAMSAATNGDMISLEEMNDSWPNNPHGDSSARRFYDYGRPAMELAFLTPDPVLLNSTATTPSRPKEPKKYEPETKFYGADLPKGVTVVGPGIVRKAGSTDFYFEKTFVIAANSDLKSLLEQIKSKFGDSLKVLEEFLDALHYSFQEERLQVYVKVQFSKQKPPQLVKSHVVVGTMVPEAERREKAIADRQRAQQSLGTLDGGIGLLGVGDSERLITGEIISNPIISTVVPESSHRIEISLSVLERLMAFYVKPIVGKKFEKPEEDDTKLSATIEKLGFAKASLIAHKPRNLIGLEAKIKGTMWKDLTGPWNYDGYFQIDSYNLGFEFNHKKTDKSNKLSVVVSGAGNVVLYDDSIAASLGNWLSSGSVLSGIREGISSSIGGLGMTIKDFVQTEKVELKNLKTSGSWEKHNDLHFNLNFQSNPVEIDITKTITKYFGQDFPVELSRFKIYEGDRLVIDLDEKK